MAVQTFFRGILDFNYGQKLWHIRRLERVVLRDHAVRGKISRMRTKRGETKMTINTRFS